MGQPKRTAGNTQISISLEQELLDLIDARAASMSMTRSAYLIHIAKLDLAVCGALKPVPQVGPYRIAKQSRAALNEKKRPKDSGNEN